MTYRKIRGKMVRKMTRYRENGRKEKSIGGKMKKEGGKSDTERKRIILMEGAMKARIEMGNREDRRKDGEREGLKGREREKDGNHGDDGRPTFGTLNVRSIDNFAPDPDKYWDFVLGSGTFKRGGGSENQTSEEISSSDGRPVRPLSTSDNTLFVACQFMFFHFR